MRLRHEAQHDRKAHAMASRTKDNLKVFTDSENKTTESVEAQEEPVVDLKHLFTKHDRRVPHLPSEKIPDMLSAMKDRQKQRKLAKAKAQQAAEAAEAAKVLQQKLDREAMESDLKHKKLCLSSSVSDKKHSDHETMESDFKHKKLCLSSSFSDKKHSPASSSSVLPKSVSADKGVESKSKAKVKKKSHPPPMSFEQLIALANQKQAEPVIDAPPSTVPKKVSTERERPMTQEEKDRQKRRETKEYQDWLKYGGTAPTAPSGGKSRHQQRAGESYKSQRMTVSSKVSGNDSSDESDSETDDICDVQAHTINGMRSYSHSTTSRLKDGTDLPHKQSPATKTHSEKLLSSRNDSSQRLVDHPKSSSHGEFLFTKGKVMSSAKANDAGQNGKSKSLSDELIEKLKEERQKMVDSGDAVPSLSDMLQDLLNKVRGESNTQELTSKQSVPSGAKSSGASSSSTKSKRSTHERKVETVTSAVDGPRSQSAVSSGTHPSSEYVTVNETVVDCARDKSSARKPMKTGDKQPVKSTWEDIYERAKAKTPSRDDRGTSHTCIRHGSVNRKTEPISDILKNRHRHRRRYFKNRKKTKTDQKKPKKPIQSLIFLSPISRK